jgi:hypothetical protein
MFGWVMVKGSAVTDASATGEWLLVSLSCAGGGIQTTKGRGGEVKVIIEGAGLTMVAVASMTRLSGLEEREKRAR